LAHARTLKRRNVHKHIFAAIITLYKTKTLHVVEEFHGAIGPFTSRFALRTAWSRIAIATTEAATIIAARCTVTIKSWTVRTRCAFTDGHWLTVNHEIGCRHLATTFHKLKLERLALGKASQASLLDSADVHEDVVGTTIYLNEAKTFLAIEKFDDSFTRADDLSRHWGAAGTTARSTKATSAAAVTAAAITAAAISTAA
jgi:hypothetical protein